MATVNLYHPETFKGSVWNVNDVPEMKANGWLDEEQYQAIMAEKAAEAHQVWLTSPDTEAERFQMLRQARDGRLAQTDYLMAQDYPIADDARYAVANYRTALRNITELPGAPWDGGGELTPWPTMPTIRKGYLVQE